jgi:DNA polymerase III alpha subunit (gram-positive type)
MFIKLLRQYVPSDAHSDEKLVMVAHNAKFDYYMMKHWFEKGGEAEAFDELFSYHCIDTVGIAMLFAQWGPLKGKVNRFSLKKLTDFFGIEFDGAAHTAGADIKATRELFKVFTDFFKDE